MNVRAHIKGLKILSDEEFDKCIESNYVLKELKLMVKEKLLTENDAIKLAMVMMMAETANLHNELSKRIVKEQKYGKQIYNFTGFE